MTLPRSVVETRRAERAQIQELAAAGLSKAEIAARLGIPCRRVHGFVSTCGIPINRAWTRSESADLDKQIEAERNRKPRPYADPELRRACKAIMSYELKSRVGFKNVNRSTRDGAWQS